MKSITKVDVSDNVLNQIVKRAFGKEAEMTYNEELTHGCFNAAYKIGLNDDREVILKISPSKNIKVLRYEKDIMNTEVTVLRMLKDVIPVPEVYYYDKTMEIIDSEYFFLECLKGQPYNTIKGELTEEQRHSIEVELGSYNKKINEITDDNFGYFDLNRRASKWSTFFNSIVLDILEDGIECDIELSVPYEDIKKIILDNFEVLDEVTVPRLVHWDLWDGNVFIKDGKIEGLIDCERALYGDPLIEFYFSDFHDSTSFCEGYGSVLPITEGEKIRRILYNIYLYLIMAIEYTYRGYDDEEHREWVLKSLKDEVDKLRASKPQI